MSSPAMSLSVFRFGQLLRDCGHELQKEVVATEDKALILQFLHSSRFGMEGASLRSRSLERLTSSCVQASHDFEFEA